MAVTIPARASRGIEMRGVDASWPHQPDGHADPRERQHDVDRRELAGPEMQDAGADVDDARGEHVTGAYEERVDRLLRLVLLLPRGGQPEQLARGVHDRVVGGVLGGLDPAHDREADAGCDQAVAPECDQRQREQCALQPLELHETRRHECLEQQRGDVHPELVLAAEGTDEGLLVEARRRARELGDVLGQQAGDDVFARGVDDVEQHDQRGDEPQVAIAQHERKAAGRCERLAGARGAECLAPADR